MTNAEPTKIGHARELHELQVLADQLSPGRYAILSGTYQDAADPAMRDGGIFYAVQDLRTRAIVCRLPLSADMRAWLEAQDPDA